MSSEHDQVRLDILIAILRGAGRSDAGNLVVCDDWHVPEQRSP